MRYGPNSPATAPCLLRHQRGIPLSGAVVCGAPICSGPGPRRGLAADRLRRGDLRCLAASLAMADMLVGDRLGSDPGGDELLLLRGHPPAPAGDGGGDRVLAGDRAGSP